MPDDDDEDSVGYGKPPKSTRFQKGQSGNPSGRRKSGTTPDDRGAIERALSKRVTVNQDGRRRSVRTIEALVMKLVEKAFNGEADAIQTLVRLQLDIEKRSSRAKADAPTSTFALLIDTPETILRALTTLGILERRDSKEVVNDQVLNKSTYFIQPWVIAALQRHLGRALNDEERRLAEKGHVRDRVRG